MSVTKEQQQIMCVLEDTATLLQKTQINLEKCPKARLTKGYIEARINIIDGYWKTFKETHQELVKITPKELKRTLPYFLNEEFFVYEELYNVMQGDLKDMLSSMADAYINAKSLHSFHNSSQQSDTLVHLPKIQIPTFHGNYEVWPAFKELFTSLLHYLKTSLAGEAESLLKHIQVTSSNYLIAWDILNTRYGNKRLLLNSTMNRLFNQKKMATQSAIHLKSLLDTTMECLHNFETLNIPTASWDPIIIFLLVQKLDPETHKCWEEYAYKDESENKMPTWSNFKKFIESKFRILELVTTNTKEFKQVKEHSFHVAISETRKVCFMCHDNHTLSHCQDFIQMETKERCKYVKNKHLCFNCLIPGHTVYKCKLRVSCQICNRRHHSLLHETKNTECVALSSTPEPIGSQHVAREREVQVNFFFFFFFYCRRSADRQTAHLMESGYHRLWTFATPSCCKLKGNWNLVTNAGTQLKVVMATYLRPGVVAIQSGKCPTTWLWVVKSPLTTGRPAAGNCILSPFLHGYE
ncbi:hypothetical protein K1T71_009897 [Dendrolimus kikuchii]|uniref:Uncharacterized protein n=1 Tax=Dendrolimus kikuchii TaxID=765133 RepID=A0ACC1CTP4_9NEOP|nr:hypothetical protein K1T71_009897 [Dendrolimus kikuchii]